MHLAHEIVRIDREESPYLVVSMVWAPARVTGEFQFFCIVPVTFLW